MSKLSTPLKAEERTILGRKVKNLRAKGQVPANVFGKKTKSEAVTVDLKEFKSVYKEVGETGLIDLKIGAEKVKHVLVHEVSLNPVTEMVNHVDFVEVDLKQKITAEVPVRLIGESPAEKQSLGTVVLQLNEIEVSALPTDLPEQFEINVEGLTDVDQAIYVKDLDYDKSKVEVLDDVESIVVKVEPPQKEEEPEVVTTTETPATEGETKTAEGAPAESAN